MTGPPALLSLFSAFLDPDRREEAQAALAAWMGADAFVLFLPDPELDLLLPAPGFPQTLPEHQRWQALLAGCLRDGEAHADLRRPGAEALAPAHGYLLADGAVLVLFGTRPRAEILDALCPHLPLLTTVLASQRLQLRAAQDQAQLQHQADQLRALNRSLDATRTALQQALRETAAANTQLQAELAERRQAEQALRRLNDTLEARVAQRTRQLERTNEALRLSNRDLQDFAYVASHDLQEPLRKVISFADLLEAECGARVNDTGTFYLQRIRHATHRMSDLIRDLLAFSRVNNTREPFQQVDLAAVAREVLLDLEGRLRDTGGTVHLDALPALEADPLQMRQLLQNLVSNALKFHRKGVPPEVWVHAERVRHVEGGFAHVLFVADNGIGFDEKYLDRIFAPFQRLHPRAQYAGSGMGLAICRQIVERHHGAITAHSSPGQGTTFVVTLPERQPRAHDAEA